MNHGKRLLYKKYGSGMNLTSYKNEQKNLRNALDQIAWI